VAELARRALRRLSRVVACAEAGVATRRGGLVLFAVGLAVYALQSVALPVIPGRDFGTYLRFYDQMWEWESVLPMSMLFRTPLAPLVIGVSLDAAGGYGAQVVLAILYAASILAWSRAALAFGRRAALLTAVALLLYPGYGILFHGLASEPIAAAAVAGWALALSRATVHPTPLRFGLVGLGIAVAALARPGNQVLLVFVLLPLILSIPWRRRVACAASAAAVAVLLLGVWAVNNGLRYDDYTVARGGNAYLPFFRAFTTDHIVSPDNGSASRELAERVERDLLSEEPYRSYGVTSERFFTLGADREFEDVVNLTDRVWGWGSDYAMMRKVALEAVRAHPGAYASGVLEAFVDELWDPLFVALPGNAPEPAPARSGGDGGSADEVVVGGRRLPRPSGGAMIPAAQQGFFSTTPDGHIREVWTSPTEHEVVFDDPAAQERFAELGAEVDRLASLVPPYSGNEWLTLQFSRSSKLFPRLLLWLAAGAIGLALRRPARMRLAATFALVALVPALFNSLMIYSTIEFVVPFAPALVVFAAAGLLGERRLGEGGVPGR
jgi:hypothetical protein